MLGQPSDNQGHLSPVRQLTWYLKVIRPPKSRGGHWVVLIDEVSELLFRIHKLEDARSELMSEVWKPKSDSLGVINSYHLPAVT